MNSTKIMGLGGFFKSLFGKEEVYREIVIEPPKKVDRKLESKKSLYQELVNLALNPRHDYTIGHIMVDIAFPEEKVAIELMNPEMDEQVRTVLKTNYRALKNYGWSVVGYEIEDVYMNTKEIAEKIKKLVRYKKRG